MVVIDLLAYNWHPYMAMWAESDSLATPSTLTSTCYLPGLVTGSIRWV